MGPNYVFVKLRIMTFHFFFFERETRRFSELKRKHIGFGYWEISFEFSLQLPLATISPSATMSFWGNSYETKVLNFLNHFVQLVFNTLSKCHLCRHERQTVLICSLTWIKLPFYPILFSEFCCFSRKCISVEGRWHDIFEETCFGSSRLT